ncbi:hypothetical protein [Sphingomonas adhaesiva]|uniref:hypothetical protein n=1 Tax=Sphingomonas adhaesiva TaxID=28212 RepID=UPI00083261D5|nr:hypothetical protein [Sphingomonas adhaesiva]
MGNLSQDLEEFEKVVGERIQAVAIGRRRASDDFDHDPAVAPIGRDEALAILDYGFAGGPGSGDSPHPFYAWTQSWIVFLSGEEGVTLAWMPRTPRRCVPEHGGSWWLCGPHDWRSLTK